MLPFPPDIFTEPDVSPDDLANLGPLRRQAGVWQADKGVDINPKVRSGGCFASISGWIRSTRRPTVPSSSWFALSIHINTPEEKITFPSVSATGRTTPDRGSVEARRKGAPSFGFLTST
jgi:hypothetical protein